MKKFVVMLKDKKAGELTQELLIQHIEHLRKMNDEGKLFICGPFKDNDKAIQIILCESLGEAINLVESDPFVKEGYYTTYEVSELLEANEENNWLIDIPQTKDNLT
ncbi:hypothetical protein H5P36_18345 [Bacillus sp. APMAM]|nr:hypothetical protein [Bacillus sp. APMAM]RTZ54566.1 hypothetical protein EKO25_17550 [Bacillus sp. SAJ1]